MELTDRDLDFVALFSGSQRRYSMLLEFVRSRALVIAISLSFFAFGFAVANPVFELTEPEIISGLLSGLVCGITILIVSLASSVEITAELKNRIRSLSL
jgi:hypothetical protein